MEDTKMILDTLLGIKTDIQKLDGRVGGLEDKVDKLEDRLEKIDDRLTSLQITVKNDIRNSIKLIAEGHIIIERKLDEVLRENRNSEKEMVNIRLNHLEDDVRVLKERMKQMG